MRLGVARFLSPVAGRGEIGADTASTLIACKTGDLMGR
jgi:hypothetical protein